MRVVQFLRKFAPHMAGVGVQLGEGGSVIDITHIAPTALQLLQGGDDMGAAVRDYVAGSPPTIDADNIVLQAPITNMDKVLCIGMNYTDHCEEQGAPIPKEPLVFNKFPSCVTGTGADLPHPKCTNQLDWEVELTIVVGKKGSNVAVEDAMDYVYGYTVAHDVSARDWQLKRNGGQWLVGKAMDKFCPIGPAIVTKDDISNPSNLDLSCSVNGVIKQNSNTSNLVFGVPELVSWVSQLTTLLPGDLILTGTPPGVGVFMKPPQFLHPGDVVKCWVQNIGTIENTVV